MSKLRYDKERRTIVVVDEPEQASPGPATEPGKERSEEFLPGISQRIEHTLIYSRPEGVVMHDTMADIPAAFAAMRSIDRGR